MQDERKGSRENPIRRIQMLSEVILPGMEGIMKLALTEANMSGLSLDVLSQALANYEVLESEGYGDLGTQALMKYYEETADDGSEE